MKADTPPALLNYFLQDDIFLLNTDKAAYSLTETTVPATPVAPEPEQPKAEAPTPAPVEETPVSTFHYMGGNKKNFLILTHYPSAQFIAAEHLTPLISTLGRINYTETDIAILNMANAANTNWQQIITFFKPVKLMILGANALPTGLPTLPINEMQQLNGLQALHTFAFEEMMTSTDNKKTFWNQVKTF